MRDGYPFDHFDKLIKEAKRANDDQQAAKYIDWIEATFGRTYAEIARKAWQQSRNIDAIDEAIEHFERQQAEKARLDDIVEAPPPVHGSARWATLSELKRSGHMVPGKVWADFSDRIRFNKVHIAEEDMAIDKQDSYIAWRGEGHLLTCGTTRSGKASAQIVPNLISYCGSVVVNDPKGELWELTAGSRYVNGSKVFKIAPFDDDTDRTELGRRWVL